MYGDFTSTWLYVANHACFFLMRMHALIVACALLDVRYLLNYSSVADYLLLLEFVFKQLTFIPIVKFLTENKC